MIAPVADEALFDALTTPLLRLDAEGRVVFANAACARWLGVSRRRLPGMHAGALQHDGEQLAALLASAPEAPVRLRAIGMAIPGSEDIHFADLWLTPHDDGAWLEVHPVDEFPGTDPAQLLPSALAASLKGLAHELRNPLAGISGAIEVLQSGAKNNPRDRDHFLSRLAEDAERMNRLTQSLLTLARVESRGAAESEVVDVRVAVRDVVAAVEPPRHVALEVDVEPDLGARE